MANKAIGEWTCPLCRSPKAKVSVSRAGLVVATCHRCHMQLFTRGDVSDGALRSQLRALTTEETQAPAANDPAPAPDATPKPAAPEKPGFLMW